MHLDDALSLSAESLLFDDDATTYGNALFRVEIFFPFRDPSSSFGFDVCCGITIFSGGTFGPAALNESNPMLLSSISISLSVFVDVGFGLAHGLLRSSVDTFLLVKFELFVAVPWNLEVLSWRCDGGRFAADLFKSFELPSVLRFLRFNSSSPSPSMSEYERFTPCSSLFSSDDLSEPLPPSDLSSPELDDESLGVVLNSYISSSSFDATFDEVVPLPDATFDSS